MIHIKPNVFQEVQVQVNLYLQICLIRFYQKMSAMYFITAVRLVSFMNYSGKLNIPII
jgi:hypothetical protein